MFGVARDMKEIVDAIYFVLDGIPHDHIDPRYISTRDMGEVSIGPKGLGAQQEVSSCEQLSLLCRSWSRLRS